MPTIELTWNEFRKAINPELFQSEIVAVNKVDPEQETRTIIITSVDRVGKQRIRENRLATVLNIISEIGIEKTIKVVKFLKNKRDRWSLEKDEESFFKLLSKSLEKLQVRAD